MASGVSIRTRNRRGLLRIARACALVGVALTSISCVPHAEAPLLALTELPLPLPEDTPALRRAAPAAVHVPSPAAAAYSFEARTPLDGLRALDCLAQAIYYEARSESEDGQRAVAQVVLNRVRHPAWPNSVCGVVYQGPMRAGGGCQFTFTCDGSLAALPQGPGWANARRLAAEALAGRSYAPVGLSTHYHTHAVFPSWAPRLARTVSIGAHQFYRLPGSGSLPAAFSAAYARSEPLPRPSMTLVRPVAARADFAAFALSSPADRPTAAIPSDIPQDARWAPSNLPDSTIREEYRQSGQWRTDAPAAVTGAR